LFDNGARVIQAGRGRGRAGKGGLILWTGTPVGNIGAGVDILTSLIVPANTLHKNGQILRVYAWGLMGADGNNKEVILDFGGTTIVDSGIVTTNNKAWYLEAFILRLAAASQVCYGKMTVDTTAITGKRTSTTKDETADLTVKVTGETTTTDMTIATAMFIEILAAP
jgi:hypothetical protein